ncbi:MAG TPA: hypothetical protein VF069_08565 [Streptosporangiaceae bacterium]
MSDPRSLAALGLLDPPPATLPLTYPGAAPETSGLLLDRRFLEIDPVPGRPVGDWDVRADADKPTVDKMLRGVPVVEMAGRRPVVAVGSNASPAQLIRKFGSRDVSTVVPMVRCRVDGIAPGISAHINRHGYVPAAPVEVPGETNTLFALWLDDTQLAALDETEPNYRRVELTPDFAVRSATGEHVGPCSIYVGRWGCLADPDGTPWRLVPQRELIDRLLARVPDLRALLGTTPESFTELAADESRRERAVGLLKRAGLVVAQRRLEELGR